MQQFLFNHLIFYIKHYMCGLQSDNRALDLAFTQTLYEISVLSTDSPDNGSEGGQKGLKNDQYLNTPKKQKSLHFG